MSQQEAFDLPGIPSEPEPRNKISIDEHLANARRILEESRKDK